MPSGFHDLALLAASPVARTLLGEGASMRMCPLPVPIFCAILIRNLYKLVQFQWVRCSEGNTRHLHQTPRAKALFLQGFFVHGPIKPRQCRYHFKEKQVQTKPHQSNDLLNDMHNLSSSGLPSTPRSSVKSEFSHRDWRKYATAHELPVHWFTLSWFSPAPL